MVRETFGNPEFADFLERLPKEVHENPTIWEEDLKELTERLHNFTYQNRFVIHPSAQTLLALFHKAKERLFKGEGMEKRKDKLRKKIEELKNDFNKIDNKVADEMSRIIPALIDLMTEVGVIPKIRMGRIIRNLDLYDAWLERYKSIVQRTFSKPIVSIGGAAFFAAVKVDDIAVTNAKLLNAPLIQQPFEPYVSQLEQRTYSILIPKLQEIVSFIRSHDNEFNIPISNTTELLPEVKELLSKVQSDFIAQLKKEGYDLTKPLYG